MPVTSAQRTKVLIDNEEWWHRLDRARRFRHRRALRRLDRALEACEQLCLLGIERVTPEVAWCAGAAVLHTVSLLDLRITEVENCGPGSRIDVVREILFWAPDHLLDVLAVGFDRDCDVDDVSLGETMGMGGGGEDPR